jgi:hypothetical protein
LIFFFQYENYFTTTNEWLRTIDCEMIKAIIWCWHVVDSYPCWWLSTSCGRAALHYEDCQWEHLKNKIWTLYKKKKKMHWLWILYLIYSCCVKTKDLFTEKLDVWTTKRLCIPHENWKNSLKLKEFLRI